MLTRTSLTYCQLEKPGGTTFGGSRPVSGRDCMCSASTRVKPVMISCGESYRLDRAERRQKDLLHLLRAEADPPTVREKVPRTVCMGLAEVIADIVPAGSGSNPEQRSGLLRRQRIIR